MLQHKLQIFPPNNLHIAQFYAHIIGRVKAYGTLQNYESAVKTLYALFGFSVDTTNIIFKLVNKAARKHLSVVPAEKPPLELAHILQIMTMIDIQDPTQVAFINAVIIGFMATLRRSNICPPSPQDFDPQKHLRRRDIIFTPEGMIVVLRWTKTNQDSSKLYKIPIAFSGDPAFDPPVIFKSFIDSYPVYPDDPCFAFYVGQKLFMLTHSDLARMLSRFLTAIGVESAAYTTHSIRKGGTTAIHRSGISSELLKSHGTWESSAYQVYLGHSYSDKLSVTKSMYKLLKSPSSVSM